MTLKIGNVRLGHATNSSSSHSIIIVPEDVDIPADFHPFGVGEYGHEEFVLSDKDSKLAYLAASVGDTLVYKYGEFIARTMMKELFPAIQWNPEWYVDHSSRIDILDNAVSKQYSVELLQKFIKFLSQDSVCIVGGNDNEHDSKHVKELRQYSCNHPFEEVTDDAVVMQEGDWWIIYNPYSGAKIHFSFENSPAELLRSTFPQLVDLKITNKCGIGCRYCYQDSTADGQHASFKDIQAYLNSLSSMGVFEVAIGGGEPITHPDFASILKYTREKGITPNFTTRVLPQEWEPAILEAARKYVGAVAVSVSTARELEDLDNARSFFNSSDFAWPYDRVIAQHVVGTVKEETFLAIIAKCNELRIPLTLLGFKDVGRGKAYSPKDINITEKLLKSVWKLSVDTSFVEQYREVIQRAGIDNSLVVPGEGRFSMYIDAVTEQAGISSYHTDTFTACIPYNVQQVWEDLGKHVQP